MPHVRVSMIACAFFLTSMAGYGQQGESTVANPSMAEQEQGAATAASGAVAIPIFQNTPQGLESLMQQMFELEKDGNAQALQAYVESIELPDSSAWFTQVFGEAGGEFSRDYERMRPRLPTLFSNTIAGLAKRGLTKPTAAELKDPCDQRATPEQYALLLARKMQEPFYVVRFRAERHVYANSVLRVC